MFDRGLERENYDLFTDLTLFVTVKKLVKFLCINLSGGLCRRQDDLNVASAHVGWSTLKGCDQWRILNTEIECIRGANSQYASKQPGNQGAVP